MSIFKILKSNSNTFLGFVVVFSFFCTTLYINNFMPIAFLLGGLVWFFGISIKGFIWFIWNMQISDYIENLDVKKRNIVEGINSGLIGALGELGVTLIFFLNTKNVIDNNTYLWSFGIGAGIFEMFMLFNMFLQQAKKENSSNTNLIDDLISPFERFYTTFIHWATRYLLAKSILYFSVIPFLISFLCFAFSDGFAHYAVKAWGIEDRKSIIKLELIIFFNAVLVTFATFFY